MSLNIFCIQTRFHLIFLFLFSIFAAFGQSDCTPIPEVDYPGGRVVMSFDGNVHDDDDILAMAYSAGLWWAAGLQDKVVQIEYSNHVCDTGSYESDGTGAGAGDDSQNMRETASGIIAQFGYNSNIFYDYERQGSASTAKMAAEIEKSTASNPLWVIAAGPMETVWRAFEAADKGFDHVTVISHSQWNENHTHCSGAHDWNDLKNEFESKGVFFVENCDSGGCGSTNKLNDQNGGFNSAIGNWEWMRDSDRKYNQWIFSRNPWSSRFDPSDAGMSYFLITGGPFNGGDKSPDHNDARKLMENPCENSDTPETGNEPPVVTITSPNDNENFEAGENVSIAVSATDEGSVAKYQIFVNDILVDTDGSDFTPHVIENITEGPHAIRVEVSDNEGGKTVKNIDITADNDDTGKDPESPDSGGDNLNFVSPADGMDFDPGETITVDLAAGNDSDIVQYQIFVNNTLVDTDPAGFTPHPITDVEEGTYTLRAEATDSDGTKTVESIAVTVGGEGSTETSKGNDAIQLSVSPADNAQFNVGATVSVDVDASSQGANIVKYQIFVNGSLVDTDPTYFTPYAITNVERGTYSVRVEVTDSQGREAVETLQFGVGNSSASLVARLNPDSEGVSMENESGLRVAPNPVQGSRMNVSQSENSDLRITNMNGVLIKRVDNAGKSENIDVSGWAPGIYILESETEQTKFIIPE
ncbi:MAG TPA: Ig-like domain-containing protein [Pricia sp.]|nr:Ig-like domain-containing protein [Pricia sp.]